MNIISKLCGYVVSIAIVIIILITSIDLTIGNNPRFFEKEYAKYDVLSSVDMSMDDLLFVSKEMMDYLKGKRQDLNINVIVAGEEREFFNDREKAHMVDVKDLFAIGQNMRRVSIAIVIVIVACLHKNKKMSMATIITRSIRNMGITTLILFLGLILSILYSGFGSSFNIFHEILFTNDLWLLDPATSLLINVLPEGFFIDTGLTISSIFIIAIIVITAISHLMYRSYKDKNVVTKG